MAGIRKFEPPDREWALRLLESTGSFSPAELGIAAELLDASCLPVAQPDYHAFVCPEAGVLILGPVPATAGSWHLYWIAVAPACQGSGVATGLQTFAEEYVRDRGGYWLLAETSSQPAYSRARAFYRKQGYSELSRIPDYYRPGDDMVFFGKRLPPAVRPSPTGE